MDWRLGSVSKAALLFLSLQPGQRFCGVCVHVCRFGNARCPCLSRISVCMFEMFWGSCCCDSLENTPHTHTNEAGARVRTTLVQQSERKEGGKSA